MLICTFFRISGRCILNTYSIRFSFNIGTLFITTILLLIMGSITMVRAQLPEQDCVGAIRLCEHNYVQNNAFIGYGTVQELDYPNNTACLQTNESNTAWYIFTITQGGTLKFQIDPANPTDDFDYALWDVTGKHCGFILNGTVPEVRCNFSNTTGSTGLDDGFANTTATSSGPNQCAPLTVNIGETYIMVVNNFTSTQNGYQINFTGTASILNTTSPVLDSITYSGCNPKQINLHLSEYIDCNTVASDGSDFTITGPGGVNITYAVGALCGNRPTANEIEITFDVKIPVAGLYTITLQTGSDGNTLKDPCGNIVAAGATMSFMVNFIGPEIDTINVIHTGCTSNDGSATITVTSGGTPPFTYDWSNGGTDATISNLFALTYSVTVTDANGCTAKKDVLIETLNSQLVDVMTTDATCFNIPDGEASTTVTGGTPPYTYSWSTGQTNTSLSGLPSGNYFVQVTDAAGCIIIKNFTINSPSPVQLFINTYDAGCNVSDGAAKVNVSGGTSPYTYAWNTSPPNTTDSIGGVFAGIYTVVVTDTQGCTATQDALIKTDMGPAAIISESQDATCGNADGHATVHASGGSPPYSFTWNTTPQQLDSTATGLLAGFYNVVITDALGCIEIISVKINEFPAPQLTIDTFFNADCNVPNGQAMVSAQSGTGNYTFNWSDGQTGPQATGLDAGAYEVIVIDSLGCKDTAYVEITYGPPSSAIDFTRACRGFPSQFALNSDMVVDSFQWTFGDPTSGALDSSQLAEPGHAYANEGTYTVTAIVTGNCGTDTALQGVTILPDPLADFTTNPEEITQTTEIQFVYTGTPAATWSWDFGDGSPLSSQQFPLHNYEDSGRVTVTLIITDEIGCLDTISREILVLKYPIVYIPNAFTPNGDGVNDRFIIKGRGLETIEFRIFNRWGEQIFFTNDIEMAKTQGWNGEFRGQLVESGVYVYSLEGKYDNGTEYTKRGPVFLVR